MINIEKHYNDLLFVPLGGACEIGMNLNAYYYKGKWLIVDVGIGFSDRDLAGIDIILPQTNFIEHYKSDIIALFITHSHEDHMGGVPYLWERLECPIYTTKFTSCVLKAKLRECEVNYDIPIFEVEPNKVIQLDPFSIEMIGITHSVPEMNGLMIRTDKGNVFHTGDWKLDPDPIIGDATNEARLKELGDEGVLAMIGDSTNIFQNGRSGSEGKLKESLENLINECQNGLVVVTTFASNIARLYSIAKAAEANGRRVVLAGRALWRLYNAALDAGYLADLKPFLPSKGMKQLKREEALLICTGCQGEPLAATSRLSKGQHPDITLNKGDYIIFSSKIIPGNEKKIFALFNSFCKMGIEVMTERDHFVHVSGHPSRDEVADMYKLIRPKIAIPVHGEAMHLHEHCKFARSLGIPFAIEVENGSLVSLSSDEPKEIERVESGYLAVDGQHIIEENSPIIRDRRDMRDNGLIVVILVLNKNDRLIRQPRILVPGVLDVKKEGELLDLLIEEVRDNVAIIKKRDDRSITKAVSSLIKKILRRHRKKEPYVMVHIEHIVV